MATGTFTPREGCDCTDKANEMDRRGTAWCRENLESIVDWLMQEARERQFLGVLTRLAPGATRLAARRLVQEAIERAEGQA